MKKFFNKLEAKLDGSSQPQQRQPQQHGRQSAQGSAGAYNNAPGGYGQQQFQQQSQQQPQYGYQQPPGPPPTMQAGGYSQPPGPPAANQSQISTQSRPGVEDPFAALRRYDTGRLTSSRSYSNMLTFLVNPCCDSVFIVDDSESSKSHCCLTLRI